jgi:hypothetical protein
MQLQVMARIGHFGARDDETGSFVENEHDRYLRVTDWLILQSAIFTLRLQGLRLTEF